jgi:hypothetical protein
MTEATQAAWWLLHALLALTQGAHAIPPVCN